MHVLQETEDVFADESDELQAKKRPAFWRRHKFREVYLPLMACAALLTAAILMRLYEKHKVTDCSVRERHGFFCTKHK